MSTYLSPIASSGDSTPPNEEHVDNRLIENTTTATATNSAEHHHQFRTSGSRSSCELICADDEEEEDEDEDDFEFDERLRARGVRANSFTTKPTNKHHTTSNSSQQPAATANNPIGQTGAQHRSLNGQQLIQNCYSKTGEQLHKLFQSASATLKEANTNNSDQFSQQGRAKTAATAAAKKIKQLLKSIPIVPLVATSIMTIIILCFLLLSNTLMFATAFGTTSTTSNRNQPQPQALAATGRLHHRHHHHAGAAQQLSRQPESIALEQSALTSLGLPISQPQASPMVPVRSNNKNKLALRRDLIESLIHQQQQQPLGAHLLQPTSIHSNKRQSTTNSNEQPLGGGGGDDNDQQQQAGFDSLGAMLFGLSQDDDENSRAATDAQATASERNSDVQQRDPSSPVEPEGAAAAVDSAAFLDGEPSAEHSFRRAHLHEGDGGERPAHLRATPPQQVDMNNLDSPVAGGSQQQRLARPEEHQSQQQHRHQYHNKHSSSNSNRRIYNNHQQLEPRRFDVAQIQCNNTDEGFERFACPTADDQGRYRCIEDRLFCDGYYDCPGGEDEERVSCMYYKLFVSHIDVLTNTFLTWMKKQSQQTNLAQRASEYP